LIFVVLSHISSSVEWLGRPPSTVTTAAGIYAAAPYLPEGYRIPLSPSANPALMVYLPPPGAGPPQPPSGAAVSSQSVSAPPPTTVRQQQPDIPQPATINPVDATTKTSDPAPSTGGAEGTVIDPAVAAFTFRIHHLNFGFSPRKQ
jgi:hypothetical protein